MNIVTFRPQHPPGCTCGCQDMPDSDTIRCWQQMQLFEQMVADIVNKILVGKPFPLLGVTDGSEPQPGQVGEFMELAGSMSFGPATQTQSVNVGILPPGDWMVQAYAYVDAIVTGAQFYLNPSLPGFSDSMGAVLATQGPEYVTIVGPTVNANISVATPMKFDCSTNNLGTGSASGTFSMRVTAWRIR